MSYLTTRLRGFDSLFVFRRRLKVLHTPNCSSIDPTILFTQLVNAPRSLFCTEGFDKQHNIYKFKAMNSEGIEGLGGGAPSNEKQLTPGFAISDPLNLTEKVEKLTRDGVKALHIISDFDLTLTKYWVRGGQRNYYSDSVIAHCPGVPQRFTEYDKAIADEYHSKEFSTTMSRDERAEMMTEWWGKLHEGYITEGFTRESIKNLVKDFDMVYRDGASDLIKKAEVHEIPLLVFSAGITDVIEELLNTQGLLQPHVHVISNKMIYAEESDPRCIGFEKPLIHALNKDKVKLQGTPFYQEVANRPNAIILGDSLGDIDMGASLNHDTVLSVGFLNFNVEEQLEAFKDKYDIVITGDSSFAPALAFLDRILAG